MIDEAQAARTASLSKSVKKALKRISSNRNFTDNSLSFVSRREPRAA
jgi:hypothetical protein